jgi:hypothetical protein
MKATGKFEAFSKEVLGWSEMEKLNNALMGSSAWSSCRGAVYVIDPRKSASWSRKRAD